MLTKPQRLAFPFGWAGHIPFIFWLIEELRPSLIVELGTHSGNSYFAMCQSVRSNILDAKCYAVDTWAGDEHSGLYSEAVFQDVNSYNAQHYASFSNLMRMTFDDALQYFSDSSIDLLHIDGMHSYEAVKHDFDNWLLKVSSRGIVIMHDIVVREREFGVWKLWEELTQLYPSFEFRHSHGLGVLFIGAESEKILQTSLLAGQSDVSTRNLFEFLGASIVDNAKMTGAEKSVKELSEKIHIAQSELQSTQSELQTTQSELQTTQSELQSTQSELRTTKSELQSTSTCLNIVSQELNYLKSRPQRRKYRLKYLQYKLLLLCPFIFGQLRAKFRNKRNTYKALSECNAHMTKVEDKNA